MKTWQFILMSAALVAGACTRTPAPGEESVPVRVQTGIRDAAATRAGTGLLDGGFEAGETFYAYFPGNATQLTRAHAVYTVGSDGSTAQPDILPFVRMHATDPRMYAYYPYLEGSVQVTEEGCSTDGGANFALSFSVQRDQSTDEGYKLSDLLFAQAAVSPVTGVAESASGSGKLSFDHLMSKIVLNVDASEGGIGKVLQVRLVSGVRTITLEYDEGLLTLGTLSTEWEDRISPVWDEGIQGGQSLTGQRAILAFSGSAATLSCAALVPPQTLEGMFVQVIAEGGTVNYSFAAATPVESGHSYTLDLRPTRAQIGLEVRITGWEAEDLPAVELPQNILFNVGDAYFKMIRVGGGEYDTVRGTASHGWLNDFYLAETECTQALYEAVTGAVPAGLSATGGDYPVANMTWNSVTQAGGFVELLNAACAAQLPSGWTFRLPSEAQWEWAFRGGAPAKAAGTFSDLYSGTNDTDELRYYGWYNANASGTVHPVATRRPNELGLYDMSGNVSEMTQDYFCEAGNLPAEAGTDYVQPHFSADSYVLRGGNYTNMHTTLTYTACSSRSMSGNSASYGFRVAMIKTP